MSSDSRKGVRVKGWVVRVIFKLILTTICRKHVGQCGETSPERDPTVQKYSEVNMKVSLSRVGALFSG